MFLAATGDVLPQDLHYLGMSPDQLCAIAGCRVTEFMVHDRASFGGTLFGLGVLYVWLTVFPLARGEQWAWWAWRRRASGRGATNLPNPPPHTNAQEREPMCTDQEHKDHG